MILPVSTFFKFQKLIDIDVANLKLCSWGFVDSPQLIFLKILCIYWTWSSFEVLNNVPISSTLLLFGVVKEKIVEFVNKYIGEICVSRWSKSNDRPRSRAWGREVAVKILPPQSSQDFHIYNQCLEQSSYIEGYRDMCSHLIHIYSIQGMNIDFSYLKFKVELMIVNKYIGRNLD